MKKIYKKPAMLAVTLQLNQMLANSVENINDGEGGSGVGYGGGYGGEGRAKESKSVWDEEW